MIRINSMNLFEVPKSSEIIAKNEMKKRARAREREREIQVFGLANKVAIIATISCIFHELIMLLYVDLDYS